MIQNKLTGRKRIKEYLSEKPHIEEFHDAKIAYIAAEKESVSGMFNNDRFIVINGKQRTLGYSNSLPDTVPIGSVLNIKNIKKKAYLTDVLIQRSKHKLKAIQIIVQKFMYKDRQEKIPEEWVFFVSSTKAADDAVQLFNKLKAECLAKATSILAQMQPIIQPIIKIVGDTQVKSMTQIPVTKRSNPPESSQSQLTRKKSLIKITPQPVVQISIANSGRKPSLSINPVVNVVSQPRHFSYSQTNNRYQLSSVSVPAYYNETIIQQPSINTQNNSYNEVHHTSPQQISQNSIQYPITHHNDSPRMPQSMIKAPQNIQNSVRYQLQIKPIQPSVASSVSQTKYSHPNNSIMNNFAPVAQVSEKQSTSQRILEHPNLQSLSIAHSTHPKNSNIANLPNSSEIMIEIESSRKGQIDNLINEPISPIQKRQRTKSRYAIDNSKFNSGFDSPNSPQRFSDQKEKKLVNIWDEESPQNADFTLKSSPVKNRTSPSKLLEGTPEQNKSNKRRKTEYSVLKDYKDWNQQLYFSVDPLQTLLKFKQFSSQVVMQVVNSLGSVDNKYQILKQSQNGIVYQHQNLILAMQFNTNSDKQLPKKLQKDIQNYIYMNKILQNKQFCRIPLVNLVKYKGITVLAKATLGNSTSINKSSLVNEAKKLQHLAKLPREEFTKCNFKLVTYFNRGSSSQIIFLDDLEQLIPSADKAYRKQLIQIASKQKGLIQPVFLRKLLQKQIDTFIEQLSNLEIMILSSNDLSNQMEKRGISKEDLGSLFNKSSNQFIKQIFTSEMLSETACHLFNTHLQNQIKSLARKKQRHSDRYLIQAAYQFMDDLCSATNNSEALWDVIINDTENKYKVKLERKYLMWGYFLSAFLQKAGLKFNINSLDKSTGFSEQYNCINAHSLEGFECKMLTSDVDYVESVATTKTILSQPPSEYGYQKLRGYLQNPSYLSFIKNEPKYYHPLIVYFSNFIPADIVTKTVINPYDAILPEPSNLTTIQVALSKMKWLLKHKDEQSAVSFLQQNCEYITFWGAEFHPLLSEFYDLLSSYYVGIGQSEQALTLAKSSLVNIIKLVGSNSLATADKFYFLANVMYNIGKYQESFGNFSKAREILLQHSINNTILGKIQLRMAVLYLHFNKLTDSELAAKEALEVFENNKQQLYLIQSFQLLDKIHRTQNNLAAVKQNALICASKLQQSKKQDVFCRTIKLVLNPFLSQLAPQQKKVLLETVQMLNIGQSKKQYFSWLFKKNNVMKTMIDFLNGIQQLIKQMRVSNIQKYKGIHSKTENQLFLFLNYMESIIGVGELGSITSVLRSYE